MTSTTSNRLRELSRVRPVAPVAYMRAWADNIIAAHDWCYQKIAGSHPHRRPWHFQWLSVKDLYADLRRWLPTLQGRVLDVGCWGKPYAGWLTSAKEHVGIDVKPGDKVDVLISEGETWPLPSDSFDSALCTQVLQAVKDPSRLVDELNRVLVPGGVAVVTVECCYHDMSYVDGGTLFKDYWRHTFYGIERLLANRFEITYMKRQGGFGSTSGMMLLNWIQLSVSRRMWTRMIHVALLPFWLAMCCVVNLAGALLDAVDGTNAFYHNVLVVVRKPRRDVGSNKSAASS